MRGWTIPALFVAWFACATPVANAACPSDAEIDAYLEDFKQRRASKSFSNDMSVADAECTNTKRISLLK